jgi:diphthamide synthase (EF-2-diphthine--ammonia ligase)
VAGPIARAAAAAGIDAAGEDGAFHTIVTACPLMGASCLMLEGRPHVDDQTGYAYMVWDETRVEKRPQGLPG